MAKSTLTCALQHVRMSFTKCNKGWTSSSRRVHAESLNLDSVRPISLPWSRTPQIPLQPSVSVGSPNCCYFPSRSRSSLLRNCLCLLLKLVVSSQLPEGVVSACHGSLELYQPITLAGCTKKALLVASDTLVSSWILLQLSNSY
jgi:hypothetical protein